MTLLEHEEVLLRGKNKCERKEFIPLSLLSNAFLIIVPTLSALLLKRYIRPWIIYIISITIYIIEVIVHTRKTYQNYNKFFGNDEIVITKDKVYYNVCYIEEDGDYANRDSSIDIKDLEAVIVKKGMYPKRISLIFKNKDNSPNEPNEHIIVHCLDNAEEICDYLTCLIEQKPL